MRCDTCHAERPGRLATRFCGGPGRIFLAGRSAGAYNAAMLAYAPGHLARASIEAKVIRGLIGLAGPYDFLPVTASSTRAISGYPDTPLEAQPIHCVGRTPSLRLAPALLLTAPGDNVDKPGNSVRLAARLRESCAIATEISYPALGPVLDNIARFIEQQP